MGNFISQSINIRLLKRLDKTQANNLKEKTVQYRREISFIV